ncbi:MAG TPA: acetyl-CoA carboxylase carboxyltransferase subunit alpha [Fimbriiglobus sp.]|jgi:acetyl-CoA carboxylase carboxyl transferase subunit alpha
MIPAPLPFEQDIFELEEALERVEASSGPEGVLSDDVRKMRRDVTTLKRTRYANLSPWESVLVARHPNRPQTTDYISLMCDEFVELHGDRAFGDDRALRTGFARIGEFKVLLVGHQKGRTLAERQACFYGCAHPEGYRKAMAKMRLAAKFHLPVVCLIDTPGAYPGIGAEERGQSQLIADSILEMTRLPTPIVCIVIGEGGSGGALGIGIGDRVAMLQHAYYSVISPEGCAGILWKAATDETKPRAADALKLTAPELKKVNVIDDIIPEPLGGAHRSPRDTATAVQNHIVRYLRECSVLDPAVLMQARYDKFRNMGQFTVASL